MGNKLVAASSFVDQALFWSEADKLHLIISPLASLIYLEAPAKRIFNPEGFVAVFSAWD
jgi:hypothetical protein